MFNQTNIEMSMNILVNVQKVNGVRNALQGFALRLTGPLLPLLPLAGCSLRGSFRSVAQRVWAARATHRLPKVLRRKSELLTARSNFCLVFWSDFLPLAFSYTISSHTDLLHVSLDAKLVSAWLFTLAVLFTQHSLFSWSFYGCFYLVILFLAYMTAS